MMDVRDYQVTGPVRTRFAPSPTGYLHLGALRTALYTWLFARKYDGMFMLRIEDTDQEREVEGATEAIMRSLKMAGLSWDEGPDVGGPVGPYIQTQRKSMYLPYALQLVETGAAYYCFCQKAQIVNDREDMESEGGIYKYDKRCLAIPLEEAKRRVAAGEPYVIRQNVPAEGTVSFDDVLYGRITVDCKELDDNVLIKSDGLPTYNFANVVDDHLMGITHIMRENSYLSSAPKYNLLYEAFGWEIPHYIHLNLIMKDATRKLSKRKGDPSFEDLLEQGFLKDAVVNYIALLGWSPGDERELFLLDELIEPFSIKGLSKSPSLFDMAKLTWFNAEYIRRLPVETFHQMAEPWYAKALTPGKIDWQRLSPLVQGRTEVLSQIPGIVGFLETLPAYDAALYTHKKMKTDATNSLESLRLALAVLAGLADWQEEAIHTALLALAERQGWKNGIVLWPVRTALSGVAATPGGAIELCGLLGREESLRRIQIGIEMLEQV